MRVVLPEPVWCQWGRLRRYRGRHTVRTEDAPALAAVDVPEEALFQPRLPAIDLLALAQHSLVAIFNDHTVHLNDRLAGRVLIRHRFPRRFVACKGKDVQQAWPSLSLRIVFLCLFILLTHRRTHLLRLACNSNVRQRASELSV